MGRASRYSLSDRRGDTSLIEFLANEGAVEYGGMEFTWTEIDDLDKPPPEWTVQCWKVHRIQSPSVRITLGVVWRLSVPPYRAHGHSRYEGKTDDWIRVLANGHAEWFHHTYDMDTRYETIEEATINLNTSYEYFTNRDGDFTPIRDQLAAELRELLE